jgi:hypothetical protein
MQTFKDLPLVHLQSLLQDNKDFTSILIRNIEIANHFLKREECLYISSSDNERQIFINSEFKDHIMQFLKDKIKQDSSDLKFCEEEAKAIQIEISKHYF